MDFLLLRMGGFGLLNIYYKNFFVVNFIRQKLNLSRNVQKEEG
ncbi:hypothetical protein J699_01400 [Acinetobacter sp. 1000160]|nr:hypothetical protein J522_1003 [Acinetobacter baumannii 146457]EYT21323.1 hypothetical protein J699_01400 [Acinetobacter sp. 1000160]